MSKDTEKNLVGQLVLTDDLFFAKNKVRRPIHSKTISRAIASILAFQEIISYFYKGINMKKHFHFYNSGCVMW